MNLQEQVEIGPGFSTTQSLSKEEYAIVKTAILEQWLYRIQIANPRAVARIVRENIDIKDYHLIESMLDHGKIWTKNSRILPQSFAKWFLDSKFSQRLASYFGDFVISDEDDLGWPNIYWRLVRPMQKADLGPLHRDEWFWNLNPQYQKPDYPFKRVKVWIPIHAEPGQNGLLVEPNSHKRTDIKWDGALRHGSIKPVMLTEAKDLFPELVISQPGQAIIFNDKLIHGGALNNGVFCRVSVEFTMLVRAN